MNTIDLLHSLWHLHVNNVFLPRSSSYEFFLTCLSAAFAPNPSIIEYGPFTGATSALLTSIASNRKGHTWLVDNWQQMKTPTIDIPGNNIANILKASVEILNDNKFTILEKNILLDPILDIAPGFIFYDICHSAASATAIRRIVDFYDNSNHKVMIVIDNVVRKHEHNEKFIVEWNQLWQKNPLRLFKPFLLTGNRLFLSNFDIEFPFRLAIYTFERYNYIQKTNDISHIYQGSVLRNSQVGVQKTTKFQNFLDNKAFWDEIKDYYNAMSFNNV